MILSIDGGKEQRRKASFVVRELVMTDMTWGIVASVAVPAV